MDGENITDKVLAVYAEYEKRGELMVTHGAGNYAEIPEDARPPRLLLVIEEYGDLRTKAEDEGTLDAFDSAMARFAKRGAKRGIHMLLLDQHFAAHDDIPAWPDSTMRNMHRLSFMQPVNDSRLVGYSAMASLQKGEFARNGERFTAWHARPEIERLLMNMPRIQPPFVLDNVGVSAVRPSVEMYADRNGDPSGGQRTPDNGQESGQELTEIQRRVAEYLKANPDAGVRPMARDLGIGKSYAGELREEYLRRPPVIDQPPTAPANVWDVLGREVIDLTNEAGADAIRRINWKEVVIK